MTYRYIRQNDLSIGVMRIRNGVISFVPNDARNTDWQQFQTWLAASPLNQIQEAW